MLGRVEVVTDVALNGGAAPTTFALGLVTGAQLKFWIEEAEMFVDLVGKVTYSDTVVERADFTIFVDGVDIANAAVLNGLAAHTAAVAGDRNTVSFVRTVRLAQGAHMAQLRMKAPAGVVTVRGTAVPCELVAFRNSHMATLGHGVDSKVQLAQ